MCRVAGSPRSAVGCVLPSYHRERVLIFPRSHSAEVVTERAFSVRNVCYIHEGSLPMSLSKQSRTVHKG